MELIGDIKTYDWGKVGSRSEVSILAGHNDSNFQCENERPYAELWMGDHVSGPSIVKDTGIQLSKVLESNKDLIGGMDKLPFLFKVLSIGKALSIQVHPNKTEAEKLFNSRPDLYKDPNHKPEIAIALTPFVALCGFRPSREIYEFLKNTSQLVNLIGADNIEKLNSEDNENGLKICFSQVMYATQEQITKVIQELVAIYDSSDDEYKEVFLNLCRDFPYDVGCICLFFFNLLHLKPGEAIFLDANEPHAYISGDCIECMACSDNVVRAGLTPKFKDVETLLRMINYKGEAKEDKLFKPSEDKQYIQMFIPKINDFAVAKIHIPSGVDTYKLENSTYGSILIVLSGKANSIVENSKKLSLSKGTIVFLPATSATVDVNIESSGDAFIAYQAMYNNFI